MPYQEYQCHYYRDAFNWLYGKDMANMSEDQFALWWRSLSEQERLTEYQKALLCPVFD